MRAPREAVHRASDSWPPIPVSGNLWKVSAMSPKQFNLVVMVSVVCTGFALLAVVAVAVSHPGVAVALH